jgi:4-hydroxybenzoyl-CoA thioesterase
LAFRTTRPLRFGDCDPSGIAYFPSYLDILVGVVEEFFETIGAPWKILFGQRRIGTPTVRLDITFLHPGFHGDTLDFTTSVRRVGRSSLDLEHQVSAAGKVLWTARQSLVATSLETNKSQAWPDDLRAALNDHLETSNAHNSAA